MLSRENNELLTRVGPGTPMGNLMRQYWVPALLSTELPRPDSDPVRVLLLGERLIAFRDTAGKVGLLPHNCPHRGASLFFGRNEEHGLRCVYHGWKFDVSGRCVDMPNEPPESNFKDKVRARAYPCVEAAGIVWAYMGPRSEPPPMPGFEWLGAPDEEQDVSAAQVECNWLQTLEGDVDTSHFGFLHVGHAKPEDAPEDSFLQYVIEDRAPRYKVLDTDFGVMYGAYRPIRSHADSLYWRIAHFMFPFYTMVGVGVLGDKVSVAARVPMDDTHTLVMLSRLKRNYTSSKADGLGITQRTFDGRRFLPTTADWYGRFREEPGLRNDFFIDRELQRSGASYTGIDGVPVEDRAVTESMGPILDRTVEHLGSADTMVIRVRRRLMAAVRALDEKGVVPPGVDHPLVYQQRSGGVVLPKDADWVEATEHLRRAGVDHADLNPSTAGGG
jgi:phthalate 4,5-dioxygenase oxygenase subunit